ncbi:MAG TPA: cobalt transporter [Aliiroseovarius sp.]|nr:cobalt transporter [Aliiroseovarius sp.]
MTAKLFTSALFAGLLAGLVAVLLQFFLIEGLILEAEEYESGAKVHFAAGHSDHDATEHAGGQPAPSDPNAGGIAMSEHDDSGDSNLTRFGLAFSNVFLTFVGWGLLMVAGFAVAERFGRKVTPSQGILWGGAGFLAVSLLPGIGLPPELPGIPAPDLFARQMWWLGTVIASGAALALFAYGRGVAPVVAGIVLLVLPHAIGAPQLPEFGGIVPPELSAEFAVRSMVESFGGFATLGIAAAWLWNRTPQKTEVPATA